MAAKNVHELIATWHDRREEEFVAEYPEPVLVGVGVVDAALLRTEHQSGSTWFMAFPETPTPQTPALDPLVGLIIPLVGKTGSDQTEMLIGRSPFCDIVLDHPAVSELHCQIDRQDEMYLLADQGSTNGTFINGKRHKSHVLYLLKDEDIVTFGQYSFQFFTPRILFKYIEIRGNR